jgi:putative NIF3 family GTP cyclohydrolase 1 type 2
MSLSYLSHQSHPLLKRTIHALESIAPLALAEAWDNVGLLIEAPVESSNVQQKNKILLTNDLTPAVLDESIKGQVGVIVS